MTTLFSQQKIHKNLGGILFLAGILFITILSALTILADYEAEFYGFERLGEEHLATLHCPILLTPKKPGLIEASFTNPGEKPVELMTYAALSGSGSISNERTSVTLDAGETKKSSWTVTHENVDLKIFVFAQVGHYAARQMPFKYATCGMVMLNVPFLSGGQLFAVWFILAFSSLIVGMALWHSNNQTLEGREMEIYRYMRFLSIVASLTLLIALQGWWVIGGIFLVISLLTLLSLLAISSRP